MIRTFFILALIVFTSKVSFGQECIGGAITSNVNYLHGRFEVRMQSAAGNGVVSSFFLYNVDLNCNWPAENNEIDVEMTGNTEDLYFTTHYPGPWGNNDVLDVPYNPHNEMHNYAFEWEPGIVRWFIDDQLVNIQDQSFVSDLIHPMRIMMNLWAANSESWVGVWDPSIMPVSSNYEWVKYYAYTPGAGNYGTGNSFTFGWQDDFDSLDTDRWTVTEEGGFDQNYCTFKSSSVDFAGGTMTLKLEEPAAVPETVPVTFRVNTADYALLPSDNINLNGGFNNWCGTCTPMFESNGIWTRTINLEVGRHEFIFAKNNWEESGGAPLGSSCDFNPCDEFANYGLIVPAGSAPIVLDIYCWGTCFNCASGGLDLNLKALLEGPYDINTGLMSDGLRTNQHLPLLEPYTASGYVHTGAGGSETTNNGALSTSGNDAIVDWIIVELRDANDPTQIVASQSAVIQRDGDIVSSDGFSAVHFDNVIASEIVVALRHRNHFGVRNLIPFTSSGTQTIDFTDPTLETFGMNPMKLIDGKNMMIAADANADGQVNAIDKNIYWRTENGNPFSYSGSKADFNMDGGTNAIDKNSYWRTNNSAVEQLD